MQGKVISFPTPAAKASQDVGQQPAADDTRAYILDMVQQLALLADQYGETVLAAMLTEVGRRQRLAATGDAPPRPSSGGATR
jgi:hypothetical protein